jgi:transposase
VINWIINLVAILLEPAKRKQTIMAPVERLRMSSPERNRVLSLHNDGKSLSQIAAIIGRARTNVQRIIAKYKQCKHIERGKKTGRPPKTTAREDRQIVRMSLRDRFKPAGNIAHQFEVESGKTVTRFTVSRRLQCAGLNARVPVSKPLISKKNQKLRLLFAQSHIVWTDDQWSRVHFSDESKFNVIGSDGRCYVRRKIEERLSVNCVKKTVKHGGGSVMVWGVISADGTGPLVRLHGRVNAEVYKQLLQQHLLPYLGATRLQPPTFMQDNAPCHTAKKVKSFFEEENLSVMDWPPQSPDLNPIENVWKLIGERAHARNPQNTEELWRILQEEWGAITPSFCTSLIKSCSRRCAAVIDSKGLFTKY